MQTFCGILIPFLGTALGAACVFFMKKALSDAVQRSLTGFAAGVMVAASVWSLLIPAIEQSAGMGKLSFLPAFLGFWLGILFLLALDHIIPHLHANSAQAEGPKSRLQRTTMMVLAVTLHNIPEGMAVGVVYAGYRSGSAQITAAGALAACVRDSRGGLNETIQYDRGAERRAEMDARTDALSKEEAKLKRLTGQNMGITNTAILLFDLAMLVSCAALVQRGELTFDGALIAVLALFSSFGPTVALANLGATLQNTFAAGNRVLDILDEEPVVDEVTGQKEVEFTGAEAEHVTFSYGGEDILSDVSVRFPEGSVVGIVGRSGSGKSTLLKLLMRFWDVQKGRVRLSGTDVSSINTGNLREMESFVTQETHLFHDSIKNNLRIAKLDATDDEIVAACKKAAVHEFIMTLPQGYDTPVGELGDTLSGGERQRLGLARAFLHDAPLMLLDEPTSNLDSLNEAVILKSLHEQCAGKTVVLVSHRASTMRIADTVYSVEHGRMS